MRIRCLSSRTRGEWRLAIAECRIFDGRMANENGGMPIENAAFRREWRLPNGMAIAEWNGDCQMEWRLPKGMANADWVDWENGRVARISESSFTNSALATRRVEVSVARALEHGQMRVFGKRGVGARPLTQIKD
jgi:hypothetical protein